MGLPHAPQITEEEKQKALHIATLVGGLKDHPGWPLFVQAIQAEINMCLPKDTHFPDSNAQLKAASILPYMNGLKKAIEIVNAQYKNIDMLTNLQIDEPEPEKKPWEFWK